MHSEIHNVDPACDRWLCEIVLSFYSFQPVGTIWLPATDIGKYIYRHTAQKWQTGYFLFWRLLPVNPSNSCDEVKMPRNQQKFVKDT